MVFSPPNPYQGQTWAGRTVGLLGGSFNPAHAGHKHITDHALKILGLDAVWWMVSPQNPLKSTDEMAPLADRMESAHQMTKNHPHIVVTDIETKLETQYTADTLEQLVDHFPQTKFVWLMGADNLHQIHQWKRWQDIFKIVPICVLDRPPKGSSIKPCVASDMYRENMLPENDAKELKTAELPAWTILHIPLMDISSTEIRAAQKD